MAHVLLADSDLRRIAGGVAELEVEADSVRRLVEALERRYPGAGAYIDRRMAFAIDGEIHQDPGPIALSPASEVCLIPRIGGG